MKAKTALIAAAAILYLTPPAVMVWGPMAQGALVNRRFMEGKCLEARRQYLVMLRSFPAIPQIRHNLGLCYYQLGKFNEAKETLAKALSQYLARASKKPGKVRFDKVRGLFHYHLGNAYFKSAQEQADEQEKYGLYLKALDCYKEALQADPGDFDAKHNYELVLFKLGRSNPPPEKPPEENLEEQDEQYLTPPPPENPPPAGKDW
ncbi:MAG: tetratricopeptide repeat protein [Bacillota bacterium]